MSNEAVATAPAKIGQLVSKTCLKCGEEQSHQVATMTKKGQISKVICSVCATVSTFKSGTKAADADGAPKTGTPYDRTRTYRKGQTMMHSAFGYGEVMSVIEPQKIDVKFAGGLRRLIHSQN
jgi:hypothetical protein